MKLRIKKLLPLLGLLAVTLLTWSALNRRVASPASADASVDQRSASLPAPNAPAPAAGLSTGSASTIPAAAQVSGPFAAPAHNGLWTRLVGAKVLESREQPAPDGNLVRTTLVDYPGKYPRILVRETIATDPRGNRSTVRQVAMVADHMLVQRAKGVSAAAFEQSLAQAGMSVLAPTSSEGLYLVTFGPAGLDALDQAMGALTGTGPVAFAEPDYVVTTSDVEDTRQVFAEGPGGSLINSETQQLVTSAGTYLVSPSLRPDPAFLKQDLQRRLDVMPAGTRILTFDAPAYTNTQESYSPYLLDQNFKVSQNGTNATDRYVFLQNAVNPGYPNNGTFYARSLSGQFDFTVQHAEALPFTALSVDLAEYSTTFAAAKAVTFTGYKAGGGTVTQTFTTDGIIDGTGAAQDFQTFFFDEKFDNLTKLVANPQPFMIDNIAVLLEGAESPAVPAPAAPVIYQVTWDAPKHTLNQLTAVAGPYAPASVNFGAPAVRSAIGPMTGPALEMLGGLGNGTFGSGYQQIRFDLFRHAQLYRIEFDAYLDQPDLFRIIADSATGSVAGSASFFTNGVVGSGSYPLNQVFKVRFDVDLVTRDTRLYINGQDRGSFGTVPADVTDLRDFRLHLTGADAASRVGLDNVIISAIGAPPAPVVGPVLTLPTQLSFPTTGVGITSQGFLSLTNTGGQNLTITSITSNQSAYLVAETFPIQLLPGGTYYAEVDFTPPAAGPQNGTLTVTSNDTSQPTKTVNLTGAGAGVPALVLSPASLSVTQLQNTTATQTLGIQNNGAGSLSWNLVPEYTRPAPGPAPDPAVTPADTFYSLLYGLKDPAVTGGGIDATHAWSITTGSAAVKVAVIDTGIDPSHPDLSANYDGANSWNFITNTNNPMDDNGHGTHVSGTIAARGNNNLGVAGVTWSCKIVALKFLDANGNGYTSDALNAVNFAAARNIRITNNSWGGGGFSQGLQDAIQNSGALFVAAAGNAGTNNDASPSYPASFGCSNILAVAATDSTDTLAGFSQYGATSVDLAAPGVSIASTYPGNQYAYMSGTSMATPHASGAAALLLSHDPALNPLQIKQLLMTGTDPKPGLAGKMVTGGRLNVYTSLRTTFATWITPQVSSGTVTTGQSQNVLLSIKTQGLAAGQYAQNFHVDSNDPLNSHVLFPVTLQVTAPTAQLTITLTPASGQWRVDGGAWQASGATITGLSAGNHTVDYNPLAGYAAPATETVTLTGGQSLSFSRSYTTLPASLTLTLTPASGQWRVDGGAWQASGVTVTGLAAGNHTVDYSALAGYTSPAAETVALAAGQSLSLSRNYTVFSNDPATLTVNLSPATGKWRLDGGTWRNSGKTVFSLAAGAHLLEYSALNGYATPASESINLPGGVATTVTRAYTELASLVVNLTPASAKWRLDGGVWRSSGYALYNLALGSHLLEYSDPAGTTSLPAETITLPSGPLTLSRTLVAAGQTAQLSITLTPGTGQWRVDGGAWQASGATVANLAAGNHTVDYSALAGYTSPAAETVTLAAAQSLSLTRSYTPLAPAQLTVTLTPASGQWRVDGGAWQASGATVTDLSAGSHSVEYGSLAGYASPANETVTLTAGQSLALARTYTQLPTELKVTLNPPSGHWRVDGGDWQASGVTLGDLTAGNHTLEFQPLTDYGTPAAESIFLTLGQSLELSRAYAFPGQLTVNLNLPTAQWRLDGGAWRSAGSTATSVAPTDHTVEYSQVPGYQSPPTEGIHMLPGDTMTLDRTYTAHVSLTITLNPASGRWRVDGGAWQASGATLSVLAGNRSVEYEPIPKHSTPAPETLSLTDGAPVFLTRNYVPYPVQDYATTDLGVIGFSTTWAKAVNLYGHVVGTLNGSGPSRAFLYRDGTLQALPLPLAVTDESTALDINDSGVIVGAIKNGLTGASRAFRYHDGLTDDLGAYGTDAYARATAINNAGVIVGFSATAVYTPPARAFKIDGGPMQLLGTLGGTESWAYGINDAGTIVGGSRLPPGAGGWSPTHAVRYQGGDIQDLGALLQTSEAYAVNLPGVVVGTSYTAGGYDHAFRHLNGSMQDLGVLNGVASDAYALNSDGTIVGSIQRANAHDYAMVTFGNGIMADLNTLVSLPGVSLQVANDINELGQIVAGADNGHSYLLTPMNSPGGLQVNLTPGSGQWRVDAGAWQNNGAVLLHLTEGAHLVEFSSLPGFTPPVAESVTVASGRLLQLSRSYAAAPQPAQLTVTLTPATGQWRIDGGAWQASGATVSGLTAGNHTVDYNALAGYTGPVTETVTLSAGQSLSLSRSYTALPASLTLTLTPATGQWRVDGGAWQASGVTVSGLVAGNHTVEYNALAGYTSPASETVALSAGQSLALSRSYTVLSNDPANLTVNLAPATAKWRLDGGTWRNAGKTVYGLTAGAHLLEYSAVNGYATPAGETVNLPGGVTTTISRTYVELAILTVNLTPATAKWRLDGGVLRSSGYTFYNLPLGAHLIEYSDPAGTTSLPAETVTLASGSLTLARTLLPPGN